MALLFCFKLLLSSAATIFMPLQKECFKGYTGISLSVRVSICVQNTCFCQSADRGIKSQLVTALVCTNSVCKTKLKTASL